MTLEEAKKEIEDRMHAYWRGFKGWDEEHWHDQRGNPYYEGKSDGLEEASGILDKVEPVGNSDKITLKELAHELRKVFKFKYLTVEVPYHSLYFILWNQKPHWNGKYWDTEMDGKGHIVVDFLEFEIVGKVDISEYKDADGNIDYSKCIVEVSDEAHMRQLHPLQRG